MRNCIITFRSVTPAQRGEAILKREGINCTLQRTPRSMQEKGCGYLNAAEFAAPGDADGLHMDENSQVALGKAVAAWVKENL